MPIQKQTLPINFSQGLDTKTDPWQVGPGKFLALENTIFTKGGLLQKRNGYASLPALAETSSYLTTFNGDLTAIGKSLQALSVGYGSWVNRGSIQPIGLDVLTLVRNNFNQSQSDAAISNNGLVCVAYTETTGSVISYKYSVLDSVTGQSIISPTAIPSAHASLGSPRVFVLGSYFIIIYASSVANNLKYLAISTANPNNVIGPVQITTSFTAAASLPFDASVMNDTLYIFWDGASSSGIKCATLTNTLTISSNQIVDGSHVCTSMSVSTDVQNNVVWANYFDTGTTKGYSLVVDQALNIVLAPTQIIASGTILNLTSSAQSGLNTVFYEISNNYSYDGSIPTHYVSSVTCNQAGVVGTPHVVARAVGLASQSFVENGSIYFLASYQSPYQPTYFLINGSTSTSAAPVVIAKLAYSNGGGYLTTGIPGVTLVGSKAFIPYLFKDLIQSVNKNTNVPAGSQTAGIYSQTGINLVAFDFSSGIVSTEIGSNLNLTGGFLWSYDGNNPVEQNFFLWPDSIKVTTATGSGSLVADTYYYQFTYEWTDNQGNAFRSAPSIPVSIVTTTASSTNTIYVPTLRLTYKTSNPVKIVGYRWSVLQQTYYQFTSITVPIQNDTTVDSVTITDAVSSTSILGNNILYTTGGVVEDIGPPSFKSVFLFDDRLWGITSEDSNLLWYSKQVIESTPVEMSDLFTMYISPSVGSQGPSGPLLCGFPMDDKAILFKRAAISYFNGAGPDNTGANSQYSQPILITSTVGCSNQKSIVFLPQGLMFEFASEAGNQIWLLGRDLSTQYIGAPVQELTKNATVQSAVSVPGTNQIRFTMDSGITLMYDFYYGQWGTFTNVPAVSSTLYQGVHAYINSLGEAFQESPGVYVDGSNPVLMAFKTSWFNLAGLQGYLRANCFYLLGKYLTPHKLVCDVAYDYDPSPIQSTLISPDNFNPTYGGPELDGQTPIYGQDTPYGGPSSVENWRVFMKQQRCMAFQVTIQEIYDPAPGVPAGAGLTMSGINLVYAAKSGYKPMAASHSAGKTQ